MEKKILFSALRDITNRGVRLWTEEGKLKFKAAAGVLTPMDKSFLRENKEEIIHSFEQDTVQVEEEPETAFEPFGLTGIQQAYVLGRNPAFDYGGTACHIYMELAYEKLDPARVESIWNALIERHPMLRATMSVDGYQQIAEAVPVFRVKAYDLTHEDPAEIDQVRKRVKSQLDHKVYDTAEWPLYTVAVTKGRKEDLLHLSIEFLVADWSSIWTLLSEFESLTFRPERELPHLSLQFRDYLTAERKIREGVRFQRDKAYWTDRLAAFPAAPQLPLRRDAAKAPPRFERRQFGLDAGQWRRFRELSRQYGVTPTAAVMSAYAACLARWSGTKRFCLNLSILNRLDLHPQVREIVGDFTSSNLLEVRQEREQSFGEIAVETNRQLFADLDHRLFTGMDVLRELQRTGRKEAALMPYVFTGAIGLISEEKSKLTGRMTENGISQTPQVFMDCQVMDTAEGLNVNLDSRTGIFPPGLCDDLSQSFRQLLEDLAENQTAWTAKPFRLPLPAWQRDERERANCTAMRLPTGLLHEAALAQIQQNPEHLAVADAEAAWNGMDLFREVRNVQSSLIKLGVKRGDRVAVALPKSRWQAAACLGILAAGAAYVPLDPDQAPKRQEAILDRVAATCVLCLSQEQSLLSKTCPQLWIDRLPEADQRDPEFPHIQALPEDLAYIIFTSGSTGEPKGVAMSHKAALNTIRAVNGLFHVGRRDRVFSLSQLNFDLSVYDLFGVLGEGGAVVYPHKDQYKNPAHWAEMMERHAVTIWNSVPALMQMLLIYHDFNPGVKPAPLRLALLSGDWIPRDQPDALMRLFPGIEPVSLGGATEGGIWSIYHRCTPGESGDETWPSIPYGRPLPNQGYQVLDEWGEPCPVWMSGELYITGGSLADAYWGDEKRTKESFLQRDAVRLYRTGDIGCYHPGGDIEFLGRVDNQVKLRGHRIELGEIEAVLRTRCGVKDACCLLYEVQGEKKLAALLAAEAPLQPVDEMRLRETMAGWLPDYMIPGLFAAAEKIPLTANGKVDRAAVWKRMDQKALQVKNDSEPEAGITALQQRLRDLFLETMGLRQLGLDEDFYEAGANSLTLARAAGLLNQKVEPAIPFDSYLIHLLNHPTLRKLAVFIEEKCGEVCEKTPEAAPDDLQALEWNQNDGCRDLCVIYKAGCPEWLPADSGSWTHTNCLYIPEEMSNDDITEIILKENPRRLALLGMDQVMVPCLRTAAAVMGQGLIPESVCLVESDWETELAAGLPYMGDIRFALTVSDASEAGEMAEILQEVCMGDIIVEHCGSEERLRGFVRNAIKRGEVSDGEG